MQLDSDTIHLKVASDTSGKQLSLTIFFSTSDTKEKPRLLPVLLTDGLKLEVTMTPLQLGMPVPNADYMYLWPTCYKSKGSHHFSGLNNLLEWLRELRRKPVYTLDCHFFYKKDTKIQESTARWRDPKTKHRERAEPPSPPQTHHFLHSPHVYWLRSSPNPRNFISRAQLIIGHWWQIQPSGLLPLSHRWSKLDWKFLSNNMVLLATGPHLWVGSKSHLSRHVLRNSVRETKYYFIAPFAQKIPRVLKAISQELWMRTQYVWEDQIYISPVNYSLAMTWPSSYGYFY